MISLLTFILILGILIIVHEFGHFIIAKKIGVRVEKFSLGFGPKLLVKKKNETEYTLSAIPLGGYVKLAGDNLEEYKGEKFEYFSQPPGKRFWIIFFGPLLNYILGIFFLWCVFFAGYPALATKVGGLMDGFGAKNAGITAGDRIIAVDGKPVTLWEDLQSIVQAKKESNTVRLSVMRDNRTLSFDVNIKERKIDDATGDKRKVGLLGITPDYNDTVTLKYGPVRSLGMALERAWNLTVITYKALWRMLTGKLSFRESMTGPLGIFYITSKTISLGIVALLHLVGVLSISLGIFNLLPLPILDGGHIVLLAIERIRGKTLSLKVERVISNVGLTMIITLAVAVTYNDVLRFFGDKITALLKR